jgi:hypothetical protein
MKKHTNIILAGLVLAAVLALGACNAVEDQSRSSSFLTVISLQGTDSLGTAADYLQSDVVVVDPNTGGASVYADVAVATIRNSTIDPNPIGGASQFNDVQLTRYVVTFSQPNGANREGIDVPYSFEGSLSTTVPINKEISFGFIIVREVAKLEPPLVQLSDGADVLEVMAKVEFYGHDLANKKIKTTGYLTIFFANYADQSSGGGGEEPTALAIQ